MYGSEPIPGQSRNLSTIVRANFFEVMLQSSAPFQQYDVNVVAMKDPRPTNQQSEDADQPVKGKRNQRQLLLNLLQNDQFRETFGDSSSVAHDGAKSIICIKKSPQPVSGPYIVELKYNDTATTASTAAARSPPRYKVTLVHVAELTTADILAHCCGKKVQKGDGTVYEPSVMIRALNIILAQFPLLPRSDGKTVVGVGQNKFFVLDDNKDLGDGLIACRGYYSSVRPTLDRLLCNINVCTAAFFKEEVLDRIVPLLDMPRGITRKSLNGLRIRTRQGTKFTLRGITTVPASELSFFDGTAKKNVRVVDYYKEKHNLIVRGDQPCAFSINGAGQKSYYPVGICKIEPGQIFSSPLTSEQTTRMLEIACRSPKSNAELITNEGLNILGHAVQIKNPVLQTFGISIKKTMEVVSARVLAAPTVRYLKSSKEPEDASWNLRSTEFVKGGHLSQWAVLKLSLPERDKQGPPIEELRQIGASFKAACKSYGLRVDGDCKLLDCPVYQDTPNTYNIPNHKDYDRFRNKVAVALERTLRRPENKSLRFVLIVLPDTDQRNYNHVRTVCDVVVGIAACCVQYSKVRALQPAYLANVIIKANLKLHGRNHELQPGTLDLLGQDTIVIGADVTHPTAQVSVKYTPSIAGVVGSVDSKCNYFPGCLRLQTSRQEMIEHLQEQVVSRIQLYVKNTKVLPSKLLYFRDGVSEGQYPQLIEQELPKLKAACESMKIKNCKITMIVCGKRHHARFYPTDPAHKAKNGNNKPGTIIDRGVTSIANHDFYLQAHHGLQGTARSAHYYVIHDDNKYNTDKLQVLTNNLSYLFPRASKAVSYIPPAYAADILCERGRCYIQNLLAGDASGLTITGHQDVRKQEEERVMEEAKRKFQNGPKPVIADTMFFM
ncbi:Piwi domain-containing protein [Pyronema omphalodes]|nr:Piwi domain-containing protein [Pyronema omphalodes]